MEQECRTAIWLLTYWKSSKQEHQKGMIKQSCIFFADQNSWSQSQTLQQVTHKWLLIGHGLARYVTCCLYLQPGSKWNQAINVLFKFGSRDQGEQWTADIKGSTIQRRLSCHCVLSSAVNQVMDQVQFLLIKILILVANASTSDILSDYPLCGFIAVK